MPLSDSPFEDRQKQQFVMGMQSINVVDDVMPLANAEVGDDATKDQLFWAGARMASVMSVQHAQAAMNVVVAQPSNSTVSMDDADAASYISGAASKTAEVAVTLAWCALKIEESDISEEDMEEIEEVAQAAIAEIIFNASAAFEYVVKKETSESTATISEASYFSNTVTACSVIAGSVADAAVAAANNQDANMEVVQRTLEKFKAKL